MKIYDIFESAENDDDLLARFTKRTNTINRMVEEFNEKIKVVGYDEASEKLKNYLNTVEGNDLLVRLFVANSQSNKVKTKYDALTALIESVKERLGSGI